MINAAGSTGSNDAAVSIGDLVPWRFLTCCAPAVV